MPQKRRAASYRRKGCWTLDMLENRELARAFVKTSSAQQTLVLLAGVMAFWTAIPCFFISGTVGSAALLFATSIFCVGLVYDVRLINDQQDEADKARDTSLEVSHLLEKRIAWRWTAVVLNVLGSIFSLIACCLFFPASKAKGKAQSIAIWNANALFGLGTLLFYIGYEIVSWDVVTIRHTLAQMNGERVPYWDTTAKVMWGFGISLALFAGGNFLILLPPKAFLIAGGVMFLVGFVIITGMTLWQAQFQWDEHVKEYYSGKTGANLGMAGQVLDGGLSDVERGSGGKGGGGGVVYDDDDAGLTTPLLPGGRGGMGAGGGAAGGAGGAGAYGQSPRNFAGRGGPVSVDPSARPGRTRSTNGRFSAPPESSLPDAPRPGQARMIKGESWGCLPKKGKARGGRGAVLDDEDDDDGASLALAQAANPSGKKKGCWTERL